MKKTTSKERITLAAASRKISRVSAARKSAPAARAESEWPATAQSIVKTRPRLSTKSKRR